MNETYYKRYLNMKLPKKQSSFLWGARKTGKTTYLKKHFTNSVYYDFLKSDVFLRFSKKPSLFREEILALNKEKKKYPIIVDRDNIIWKRI